MGKTFEDMSEAEQRALMIVRAELESAANERAFEDARKEG